MIFGRDRGRPLFPSLRGRLLTRSAEPRAQIGSDRLRLSAESGAPKKTICFTIASHWPAGRVVATTRSRPWQIAQLLSTSSLPGPSGSVTATGGCVENGMPGPKLVVR